MTGPDVETTESFGLASACERRARVNIAKLLLVPG
jgi:hypothetical protein